VKEKTMAQDLTIVLKDKPGKLAEMGEVLGKAGINMLGACGVQVKGKGRIHILVEDAQAAKKALKEAGIKAKKIQEVLLMDIQDNPGELGKICRKLSDVGVNIELVYLTAKGQLVIGVDNPELAKTAM
jgi:hypothetical protein